MLAELGKVFGHIQPSESPTAIKARAKETQHAKVSKNVEPALGKDSNGFIGAEKRVALENLIAKSGALRDMGVRSSPHKMSDEYFAAAESLVRLMRGSYSEAIPVKRTIARRTGLADENTTTVHEARVSSNAGIASGRKIQSEIHSLDEATIAQRTALAKHAETALHGTNERKPLPADLNRVAFQKLNAEIHSMVCELTKIHISPKVLESILQSDGAQTAKWKEHWTGVIDAEPLKNMQQRLVNTRDLSDDYTAAMLIGEQIAHTGQGNLKQIATHIAAAKSHASKGSRAHGDPVIAHMEDIFKKSKAALRESVEEDLVFQQSEISKQTTIARSALKRTKQKVDQLRAVEHPESHALSERVEGLELPKQTT